MSGISAMYGWNRFFALDLQYRDWQFGDAFGTLALLPACEPRSSRLTHVVPLGNPFCSRTQTVLHSKNQEAHGAPGVVDANVIPGKLHPKIM